MSDIVERLRNGPRYCTDGKFRADTYRAADELERLRADLEKAKAALRDAETTLKFWEPDAGGQPCLSRVRTTLAELD